MTRAKLLENTICLHQAAQLNRKHGLAKKKLGWQISQALSK